MSKELRLNVQLPGVPRRSSSWSIWSQSSSPESMALDSEPRQSPNFNLDENAAWEELKQIDYIIITFTNPEGKEPHNPTIIPQLEADSSSTG